MPRDRESTKTRILEAAERLVTRAGFGALGVNAVAAEAGVDKVLIYRYFGGLPQLLTALAGDGKLWPSLAELASHPPNADGDAERSFAASTLRVLRAELAALRERPLAQQALAWELAERNALTAELATARAARHGEMLEAVRAGRRPPPYVDAPALIALLSAGLTYLALVSSASDRYMELELDSEDGWRRIDKTLATVVRALLEPVAV